MRTRSLPHFLSLSVYQHSVTRLNVRHFSYTGDKNGLFGLVALAVLPLSVGLDTEAPEPLILPPPPPPVLNLSVFDQLLLLSFVFCFLLFKFLHRTIINAMMGTTTMRETDTAMAMTAPGERLLEVRLEKGFHI